jgi:hypothetical protein
MDLATVLHAMVDKQRAEAFAKSEQLSLGELVLKLDAIADKTKAVVFDFGDNAPVGLGSWRGIYAELSLHYGQVERTCVADVLAWLREADGKTFEGYKGGDFTMSRQTPIWVANYGQSGISGYKDSSEYTSVAVVDVMDGEKVTLVTQAMES